MGIIIFSVVSVSVSCFNIIFMHEKEKKLRFEFDKKLEDDGYEKTDDSFNLVPLIASSVIDPSEYAARIVLSIFPIANLYPFIQIITKKLDKEYNVILDSLDNEEVLDILEKNGHIYNQNIILRRKLSLANKISKIEKNNEPNKNINESIKINENDSLEQLKQKQSLLNEMIYLRSLEENGQYQENQQNSNQVEKVKQLKLVKKI